jgi:hypothetical protein
VAEKSVSLGAAAGGSPSLDQEKIKECDKVLCVTPVQVNSSSPSVSESINNDGNITVSEGESLSCSKMSPHAGACATPISPAISAVAGFSPVCAAAVARAPGAAVLGDAVADCAPAAAGFSPHFAAAATVSSACAPAATGFLPHFAAAACAPAAAFLPGCAAAAACAPAAAGLSPDFAAMAAANTAVVSTPLIIPGVYASDFNSNLMDMGHDIGNINPLVSSGGAHTSEGTGVFLGGRYSMEEVIKYGGISQADSLVRTSERIRGQANADDTQMDRAMHLTEAKNIGSSSGKSSNFKFFLNSIPHDRVISNAFKLGVSLGDSPSDVIKTIDSINRTDSKRTLIMLSKNLEENLPEQSVNDQNVLYQAEKLSYDLENEYTGDSDDCLDLTLAEIKKNIVIKKKVRFSKPVVRRSSRLKKKSRAL